jgi:tRNA threonylcarbamoyladenosine biosynthesis protein TsaE
MKYVSSSVKETHKIAEEFVKEINKNHDLKNALVVVMKGDLGSGKTEFVKGLKKVFGIENNILSPTFVLMKVYMILNLKFGFEKMYHFDLYRLLEGKNKEKNILESLETLNIYDILKDNTNIVFIEWGENLKMLKKYKPVVIEITNKNNEERKILIS